MEEQQASSNSPLLEAFSRNFLGSSPRWYKQAILLFLVLNPLIYFAAGPFSAGWLLVAEFIFTLAMAPKCYPLQPGGLLALEAIAIGMAHPDDVLGEVLDNFEVVLLLVFMVAGIFFLKNLLLYVFTKILLGVRSKILLSLLFCFVAAFLSAFLDALTVAAVLVTVCLGFYRIYQEVATSREYQYKRPGFRAVELEELAQFRAFLRSLLMHGLVGTALGGVCTLVGEPQNLLIANIADWHFAEFFIKMAPVSMPALGLGLVTCVLLERTGMFGYGTPMPAAVRQILHDFDRSQDVERTLRQRAQLLAQGVVAILLIFALAFHVAAVGLIGLGAIILLTAVNGFTEEHQISRSFQEALPFTALLVVFFALVAVIHMQELFKPVIDWVLDCGKDIQPGMFFLTNGALSMVSDNVFVATIYISEVESQLESGAITREHFDLLAISINTGTNLPSVATPNGQAAFLFLLASSLAPQVRLNYRRMIVMALPYTMVLTGIGFLAVYFWL